MHIACLALGLFVTTLIIHLIIWRIRLPRRQSLMLLVIFLGLLLPGLFAVEYVSISLGWGSLSAWKILQIVIFHISMTLGYVVTYSALEGRSPSMTILTHVADSGSAGRTREDLDTILRQAVTVEIRIEAMLRDGMIVESEGEYRLTPKGWGWARTFLAWNDLVGMERGG